MVVAPLMMGGEEMPEPKFGEWQTVDTLPPPMQRPGRVFVIVEGSQFHSGINWHRRYAGLATTNNEGFDKADIEWIESKDHMDPGTGVVTHWMPWCLPDFPPLPPPPEEKE